MIVFLSDLLLLYLDSNSFFSGLRLRSGFDCADDFPNLIFLTASKIDFGSATEDLLSFEKLTYDLREPPIRECLVCLG